MSDSDRVPEWHAPELDAAREDVARALQRYADEVARQRGESRYFITEWLAVFEATSVDLEQADKARREVVVPTTQSLSSCAGLGAFAARRWV